MLSYVVIVGGLMTPMAMVGYEGAATLSQETISAQEVVPENMLKAVTLSVFGGFFMMLSLLFACRTEVDSILAGPTL